MNWRDQPLTNHEVIVNLIARTTTFTGLIVTSELDETIYPKGIKITDREMRNLETQHITRHDFRGEREYGKHGACPASAQGCPHADSKNPL